MSREVMFILGLQGVGKSVYIADTMDANPTFSCVTIDYEELRNEVLELYPDPAILHPQYDASSYYKLMAADMLRTWLETKGNDPEVVIVECTGMTKQNQAGIRFMCDQATKHGATYSVVYLRVGDEQAYQEVIQENQAALNMYKAYRYGGPKWCEPHKNPLLDHVVVREIDHNEWLVQPF